MKEINKIERLKELHYKGSPSQLNEFVDAIAFLCLFSITRITSAQSRSLAEIRFLALELVPADHTFTLESSRYIASAVGLRHLFLEQTNKRFTGKINLCVISYN